MDEVIANITIDRNTVLYHFVPSVIYTLNSVFIFPTNTLMETNFIHINSNCVDSTSLKK